MIPALLGFSAGVAASIAILHLVAGLRGRINPSHVSVAALAISLSAYATLSLAGHLTGSAHLYANLARAQGAVASLAVLSAWWFVRFYTDVRPGPLLWGVTAALALALVASLVSPGGFYYGEVEALRPVLLPWGESAQVPVATADPLNWIFNLPLWASVPYLMWAVTTQYRRGEHGRAVLLGAASVVALVPVFVDVFVLGPETFAFPFAETAMLAFLGVMSLGLSDDLVRLADLQRALEHSEESMRVLAETAPDAIAIVDVATLRLAEANRRARVLYEIPEDAPANRFELPMFIPDRQPDGRSSRDVLDEVVGRVMGGEELPPLEVTARSLGGREFPVEVRVVRLPDVGHRAHVRLSSFDITARKEAERRQAALVERLHQSQKMETMGTLAGGIAHDFNNLLTPILGYSELLLSRQPEDAPERRDLLDLREAAERARELVRQILTFSRKVPPRREPVMLQDAVRQAAHFLAATLPARIQLALHLGAPDAWVKADSTQVQQVVMNLGTNAVQAMPEGGRLEISLRPAEPEDVPADRPVPEAGWAVLEVADTGGGIAPEHLGRVFDPFFTTRSPEGGTGLGLSVVHGIARSLGGYVDVASTPGQGTRFKIHLPLTRTAPETQPPARVAATEQGRLLVVDDNRASLGTLARMLSALGYEVCAEPTPARALAHEWEAPPDAAVIDFDLPGMDGAELAAALRRRWKALPVVCVSGSALPELDPSVFDAFLLKPVRLHELRDALRSVLART